MDRWKTYLEGGDLRSIAGVDELVSLIQSQADFDRLFAYLYSEERLIRMRAADAIEKISAERSEFLSEHKVKLIQLLKTANYKELKWHLALIISRVKLTLNEFRDVWKILSNWAKNKKESKIVRVNALQSLFELSNKRKDYKNEFHAVVEQIKIENIPSINARLRKLKIIS